MADFSVANIKVTDMEIANRTLFFCGNSDTGAVFGHFDIPSFFSGTSMKVCRTHSYPSSYNNSWNEVIRMFYRIEVQRISDTDVHIYMIADAYLDNGTAISNDYRCVVDVWDQGNGANQAFTFKDHAGGDHFDDLAVTDHDLVVVGDKNGGIEQKMYRIPLPPAMTPTSFQSISNPLMYWSIPINEFNPLPEATIEHIDSSVFAVASEGIVQSTTLGIVVSIYNGVGNPVDRILVDDTNNIQRIKELRYNQFTRTLSLLPNRESTGKKNSHYVINLSNANTIIGVNMYTPTIPELHSLDLNSSNIAMVSGDNQDSLRIWQSAFNGSHCVTHSTEKHFHFSASDRTDYMEYDVDRWFYQYEDITPAITIKNINIICDR